MPRLWLLGVIVRFVILVTVVIEVGVVVFVVVKIVCVLIVREANHKDGPFRMSPFLRRSWPCREPTVVEKSTRSDGRSEGTPKIDPASRVQAAEDREGPSRRRNVDSECAGRCHYSWTGFYIIGRVIPAVVLAAGRSTRMGRPKALLPLGERETFLTRVVRTFLKAKIEEVIVVVGHQPEALVDALSESGFSIRVVVNPRYDAGQLSSILAGLEVIDRPAVTAMLLTLVDVPLVLPETISAIVRRYHASHAPVVRPVSRDRHGHPIIIDRSLFGHLRATDPAAGLKPLVHAYASAAGDVEVVDEGAFADVDTPEDYARVLDVIARRPLD